MSTGVQSLDQVVKPTGMSGVYLTALRNIDLDALPAVIAGRPVTALAPHPHEEELIYLTTDHPETLAFLPDPYLDLRP